MIYNWDFKYKELIIEMYKEIFTDIEKENFDTSVKFFSKDSIAKTIVAIDEYRNEGLTIFEASIRTKKYLKLIYKNEFANYAAPKAWQ